MKTFFTLSILLLCFMSSVLTHSQTSRDTYYTVIEVYTNPDINNGDVIQVAGYYTNADDHLMIYFYGDYDKDRPYAPHTVLTLTGIDPPLEANAGGYIYATGTISFQPRTDPYYPEDSLMAFLNASLITVVYPGVVVPYSPGGEKERKKIRPEGNGDLRDGDCDPCKFAFLLSGGADSANNHSKYWENLVALYHFKVDSLDYCDSNVFVSYFKGDQRDNRIPAGRVIAADSAKIDSIFAVIAKRVGACTHAGTPATFQKMVTNHGESDGDICLLGDKVIKPGHLKDLQQRVIDSCCRTVYDEFIECYGGKVVDELKSLDNLNKATIYINSNANDQCGYSPHGAVHPYLQTKINSLDTGASYPDAVVNAKLAYDEYLQSLVDECHQRLEEWRAPPPDPEAPGQIALWLADSTEKANAICKSRNVTIVPFTHYCQWQKFVVPPGGQLVVKFDGKSNTCGNATVYKENRATGVKTKVKVWNWNHPGSYRFTEGNQQRVINADFSDITTFWIHNDNDTSRLEVQALASQFLPESQSNGLLYPGFSLGGTDNSINEFGLISNLTYFFEDIDQLNFPLTDMPAILGPDFVQNFGFSFQINPSDPFWTDMQLILNISQVTNPDILSILSPSGTILVPITEPGTYVVPLGDFAAGGDVYGIITMIPQNGLQMVFDSWGLRSVFGLPEPPVSSWLGVVSDNWNDPLNWSDGVPGPYGHAIIRPTVDYQPRILTDVTIWRLTVMEGATINTAPGINVIVNGK